jgi:hypothetical protein
MVLTASHTKSMGDPAFQAEKLTSEMAAQRADHLQKLIPLEKLARALAPLPMSYDVSRLQQPYFFEFTYTEMLGCFWVCPQSSELAARTVEAALRDDAPVGGFDPAAALPLRDKYRLAAAGRERPPEVVFTPGDNVFDDAISPDYLLRLMHDDPDVIIKPHPMTTEGLVRRLGRAFGYHRVLDPNTSGAALVGGLSRAHISATTEMGFYALLAGAPINNIGRFPFEARAVYTPFYRLLWGLSVADAQDRLRKMLRSPLSGFFHPDDPDLEAKMRGYFANTMELRAPFKPLVQEFGPERWSEILHPARTAGPSPAPMKGSANAVG